MQVWLVDGRAQRAWSSVLKSASPAPTGVPVYPESRCEHGDG